MKNKNISIKVAALIIKNYKLLLIKKIIKTNATTGTWSKALLS